MASLTRIFCASLLCFLSLIHLSFVSSKQILMVPFVNTSHTIILHALASRLAARGHSVSVLWTREFTQGAITGHPNFTLIEFSTRMKPDELAESCRAIHENFANPSNFSIPLGTEAGWLTRFKSYIEIGRSMNRLGESVSKVANAMCKAVLSDDRLMSRLQKQQFDIALVDDYFLTRCLFLIPHSLGIKYVSVGESTSWWDMRLPLLPASMIGSEGPELSALSTISISHRLSALSMLMARHIILQLSAYQSYSEELSQLVNVSSLSEFLSLPSRSTLFFHLWDHLMTGIALPKLPHVEYIGGITAGPAKELNSELNNWADAASEGFVVCTFGSMLTNPTESMLQKLFQLFADLQPHPVIFRLSRDYLPDNLVAQVPPNVKLMHWLPQNDLLGHPNARLFITHAGTNGYGEALYHGVPLVAFPLLVPQKYMASKIAALGYGKEADLFSMNVTELVAIAKEVLIDTRYRQRVGKVSKIMKARKHPGEVAADSMEHVMEYGADHLQPHASLSLNIIEFYMLDVVFLASILFIGFSMITFFLFSLLIKCIWRMLISLWIPSSKTKLE